MNILSPLFMAEGDKKVCDPTFGLICKYLMIFHHSIRLLYFLLILLFLNLLCYLLFMEKRYYCFL